MIKKMFILMILLMVIALNVCPLSFASSVKVTDENLNTALQAFINSGENKDNVKITVENNQIKVKSDEGNYIVDYDLTDKPTFTCQAEITQGMSYNEFEEKTGGLIASAVGYGAVANIQGANIEDASSYILFHLLFTGLSKGISASSSKEGYYTIVDDTKEGTTIVKDPNDEKTIYVSEFGNHVMEYVNSLYGEKQTFSDADELNTYEMTIERKDVTPTSCKLVSTLTVNTDADFSKVNGYAQQMTEQMVESLGNSLSNSLNESLINKSDNKAKDSENKTADLSAIPKTGEENSIVLNILYTVILLASIGVVCLIITKKNKKQ